MTKTVNDKSLQKNFLDIFYLSHDKGFEGIMMKIW